MPGAAIRAQGWSYHHAGRPGPVLSGVDLDVAAGDLVVVVGASGSGKSTLLAGLGGSLPVEGASGTLGIEPVQAGIGVVRQQPEGNIVMERVGDDLAFPLENAGVDPAQIWPRVHRALDDVGLDVDLSRDTAALSGGQQQLLAIAAAIVVRPGLLLLDEPTANLDEASAARVREVVLALRGTATIIVVEHRLSGWIEHADRVLLVADGSVRDVEGASGLAATLEKRSDIASHVWTSGWQAPDLRPRSEPGAIALEARNVGVAGRLLAADLTVRAGEVVAVTGSAGCGKSTLLACVSGLMRPDEGAVVRVGSTRPKASDDPWKWPSSQVAATFGVVFQDPEHQFVTSRVIDELRHGLVASGVETDVAERRAAWMLDRLGLAALAEANPFTLSGGEQRRLSVATALVLDPRVLVLDEPTFGQDPATWAELARIIADHRDAGGSVLLATHDRHLVAALGPKQVRITAVQAADEARPTPFPRRTQPPGGARPEGIGTPRGLRRLSPLALLGSAGLLSTAALLSGSVALNVALAGMVLLGGVLGRIPGRGLALMAVPALLATASVALSNALLSPSGPFSPEAWQAAALPASRVLAVALPGLVTAAALDPTALADSLMLRWRVSPRAACAVLAALRLLPLLQADWAVLARASRARGLAGRGLAARARQFVSMTFRLLVAALRRGVRLAAAMEARGLPGQGTGAVQAAAEGRTPLRRTIARPLRRSRWDVPLLLLGLAALVAAVATRG